MEDSNLNKDSLDLNDKDSSETSSSVLEAENIENKIEEINKEEVALANEKITELTEAEYVYSLIESAVPSKAGFRKNISKRDFALWVLPIVAINTIRRFTSKKTSEIIQPFNEKETKPYLIRGDETIYTNTKNVFAGKEKMKFFGFRFMSIWVFPMAVTGAFMEFLFVGPLKGTNPFG